MRVWPILQRLFKFGIRQQNTNDRDRVRNLHTKSYLPDSQFSRRADVRELALRVRNERPRAPCNARGMWILKEQR